MRLDLHSEFLQYLAQEGCELGRRLPPSNDLAQQLGISISKLREQLEVARSLGLIEIRPKIGIRGLGYSFTPGVRKSVAIALMIDPKYFESFGKLRDRLEAAFWHEAVRLLRPKDKKHLKKLIEQAWEKLRGEPVQIPHEEHRELHLTIYSRLNNPFVAGLLEAYWDAYETVGLNVYSDYQYLEKVWLYHQRMVEAILEEDYDAGYRALVDHIGMLHYRRELENFVPTRVMGAERNSEPKIQRSGK